MGFWPDWWPANPIGSAWDNTRKTMDEYRWVGIGILILIGAIVVYYFYSKVK